MASDPLQLDFITVDVFTRTKYEGNPLAIVRVPQSCTLTQKQKQAIAREFNLSETTFLHESDGPSDTWTVDIFTTKEELPFAGHPTIGTACFVLSGIASLRRESKEIKAAFKLKAGPVQLHYDVEKNVANAEIPHNVRIHGKNWSRGELLNIQSALAAAYDGGQLKLKDEFPIVSIVKGLTFILIELESLEALQLVATTVSFTVDGLDEGWSRTFVGTYFFVRTGTGVNGERLLRARMIEGNLEDPATGSAASDLAAYLSLTESEPGQNLRYIVTQGVEMGRRSNIHLQVSMKEGPEIDKVVLGGSAVRVMEGRVTV